ncbi:fructoselysine 6-kinase [Olegusella massiliensis]|uniref:fructoselysine 6-kinase n=1 Tax=Olegusella massiliensis TaxID=1776381 RepID=UPI000837C71E|nr:fructoselysine 6-kinase [Olegusella massiliensis]
MRTACIGDNCIDDYPALGRKYPTGNAVDTAVNLQKLGMPTSIISTTGSDANGQWMIETLAKEGLDISHLKKGSGATAITYMELIGKERVHGEYQEGVLKDIVFDDEDVRFAAEHDLVHSAFWGHAESVLPAIHDTGTLVSFDYADRLNDPLVEQTASCVDIGFFSFHEGKKNFDSSYLRERLAHGMKVAVATFGEEGSIVAIDDKLYDYGIKKATVVNTIGAGDSFISGFLYAYLMGEEPIKCLEKGAEVAAQVVGVFEPWVGMSA